MMGMRQDFVWYVEARVYEIKVNRVVNHSLNYTESYEIYVGTHGLLLCSWFRCT